MYTYMHNTQTFLSGEMVKMHVLQQYFKLLKEVTGRDEDLGAEWQANGATHWLAPCPLSVHQCILHLA